MPSFWDASGLKVEQREATSLDGTKVPYFLVRRGDVSGTTPTLLYGYGGFEISEVPHYSTARGVGWLEKGYAFALANIRGGGEFGPKWHQGALKEKRHKAYEDFEAIARDLVHRGVTTARQLGAMGGSNGGLLMGNMLARSPELFGAIVCQVPLLDMRRTTSCSPARRGWASTATPTSPRSGRTSKYSPYHTVRGRATTARRSSSRRARATTASTPATRARCTARSCSTSARRLYYENIEGGHGGAADNKQPPWSRSSLCSSRRRSRTAAWSSSRRSPPWLVARGGRRRFAGVALGEKARGASQDRARDWSCSRRRPVGID